VSKPKATGVGRRRWPKRWLSRCTCERRLIRSTGAVRDPLGLGAETWR
jgi:hypothetical protein